MNRRTILSAVAGLAFVVLGAVNPNQAHAQFFDFGFGGSSGDQSTYTVSFSKNYAPGQIIVSFGDRRLYYVKSRGRAISYPIAIPRPQSRWSGTLRVSQKRVDPPWTPTPEMRRENPKLPASVPGGHPYNPLGVRALYLGNTLYRIHGTDAPWTIGQNVSKGCVRMHNSHVIDLYNRVGVGTKVTATWTRFNTNAVSSDGGSSGAPASSSSFTKSILGDNT